MYVQKNKVLFCCFGRVLLTCAAVVVFSLSCVGPKRVNAGTITDESIVRAQASAARLEAVNAIAGRTVEYSTREIGRIRLALQESVRGVDDAFAILDEYDRFVQELIRRIRQLEQASGEKPDGATSKE